MKIQSILSISVIALSSLVLSACGNAEDENNTGGGTTPPRTIAYAAKEQTTTAAAMLKQLQEGGAKGYRNLSEYYFDNDRPNTKAMYAKDENVTYSYEIISSKTTKDEFLNDANAQGSNGYIYTGDYAKIGSVYRKNDKQKAKFSYEMLEVKNSVNDFLMQANAQGEKGFIFVNNFKFDSTYALYVKDSESASKYSYIAQPTQTVSKDFIDQASTQGASGYKFKNDFMFGTQARSIFIKDITQSSNFSYTAMSQELTSEAFLKQADKEGGKGIGFFGLYAFNAGKDNQAIYFIANKCTGFLCAPANPLIGF